MGKIKLPPPPRLDVHGVFLQWTDWSGSLLRDANLSNADLSNASFRRSNLIGARLTGTILRGADLTDATNLTLEQLAEAIIDEHTKLPTNIDRQQLLARSQPTEAANAVPAQ